MAEMLVVDGSQGEGGGQILRTSLALAAVTGQPVRITNIRAGRRNPGLAAQHVIACRAVAEVCNGALLRGHLHSVDLELHPGSLRGGDYFFDVSQECPSAGSTTLILQAVLPALLWAPEPTSITLVGGTEVPWSPLYSYLAEVFAPLVRRMGGDFDLIRVRPGWYPVGGGEVKARVRPLAGPLQALDLRERGALCAVQVHSLAEARLPDHILQRQVEGARRELGPATTGLYAAMAREAAACPGTSCLALALFTQGAAGYSALGKAGKPAEEVGAEAGRPLQELLDGHASVDEHLADQLQLYAALAQGTTSCVCPRLTGHLETNARVIQQMLGVTTISTSTPTGVELSITGLGHQPPGR